MKFFSIILAHAVSSAPADISVEETSAKTYVEKLCTQVFTNGIPNEICNLRNAIVKEPRNAEDIVDWSFSLFKALSDSSIKFSEIYFSGSSQEGSLEKVALAKGISESVSEVKESVLDYLRNDASDKIVTKVFEVIKSVIIFAKNLTAPIAKYFLSGAKGKVVDLVAGVLDSVVAFLEKLSPSLKIYLEVKKDTEVEDVEGGGVKETQDVLL